MVRHVLIALLEALSLAYAIAAGSPESLTPRQLVALTLACVLLVAVRLFAEPPPEKKGMIEIAVGAAEMMIMI
jgi:hypothetical protein